MRRADGGGVIQDETTPNQHSNVSLDDKGDQSEALRVDFQSHVFLTRNEEPEKEINAPLAPPPHPPPT